MDSLSPPTIFGRAAAKAGRLPGYLRLHAGSFSERARLAHLYRWLHRDAALAGRVREVMQVDENDPRLADVQATLERALPANRAFRDSGWTRRMLTRYALAAHVAKGKRVLDTCSGLGWGAYLVDAVAKEIVCLDADAAANAKAAELWSFTRTSFVTADALAMPLPDASFDVVLAMESIEHFTREDGETYLAELARVLRPGGVLVGSTPLTDDPEAARANRRDNPYHQHIYSPASLAELLGRHFGRARVFHNRLYFQAWK